jgi:hypothetical protein
VDAISRAISEAANNESGASSIHWLLLPEEGRTAITEGELAQLQQNELVKWSDEEGCYILTQYALDELAKVG